MCQPIRCRVCHKTTWTGCGQHVASVKRTVPASEWCGGTHTPAEIQAAQSGGFFARLFGRNTTTTGS